MKTSASLISRYRLLRIHDFIRSSGKFISKVALPLRFFFLNRNILCFNIFTWFRKGNFNLQWHSCCLILLHTDAVSFGLNSESSSEHPRWPCYFSPTQIWASSCSFWCHVCVAGSRQRATGGESVCCVADARVRILVCFCMSPHRPLPQ